MRDLERARWPTEMGSLENIPRLRAAVKEGIRWAGAAAAMLPRVVPDGGATLAGVFVVGEVSFLKIYLYWALWDLESMLC